jgi:hypothetical protein
MESLCSSETSVDFQRTTRRYIPKDQGPSACHLTFTLFSCFFYYFTMKMSRSVPPKGRLTFSGLHGDISQVIQGPSACHLTLTLVSCLPYSFTMKMKSLCSSETSVDFQRTSERYIPDDSTGAEELDGVIPSLLSSLKPGTIGCAARRVAPEVALTHDTAVVPFPYNPT